LITVLLLPLVEATAQLPGQTLVRSDKNMITGSFSQHISNIDKRINHAPSVTQALAEIPFLRVFHDQKKQSAGF
jgi:hypothetical protein